MFFQLETLFEASVGSVDMEELKNELMGAMGNMKSDLVVELDHKQAQLVRQIEGQIEGAKQEVLENAIGHC